MRINECGTMREIVGAFKLYHNGYEVSATTMRPDEIAVFYGDSNAPLATFTPDATGMREALEYVEAGQ